jgi:hypothetical protein
MGAAEGSGRSDLELAVAVAVAMVVVVAVTAAVTVTETVPVPVAVANCPWAMASPRRASENSCRARLAWAARGAAARTACGGGPHQATSGRGLGGGTLNLGSSNSMRQCNVEINTHSHPAPQSSQPRGDLPRRRAMHQLHATHGARLKSAISRCVLDGRPQQAGSYPATIPPKPRGTGIPSILPRETTPGPVPTGGRPAHRWPEPPKHKAVIQLATGLHVLGDPGSQFHAHVTIPARATRCRRTSNRRNNARKSPLGGTIASPRVDRWHGIGRPSSACPTNNNNDKYSASERTSLGSRHNSARHSVQMLLSDPAEGFQPRRARGKQFPSQSRDNVTSSSRPSTSNSLRHYLQYPFAAPPASTLIPSHSPPFGSFEYTRNSPSHSLPKANLNDR